MLNKCIWIYVLLCHWTNNAQSMICSKSKKVKPTTTQLDHFMNGIMCEKAFSLGFQWILFPAQFDFCSHLCLIFMISLEYYASVLNVCFGIFLPHSMKNLMNRNGQINTTHYSNLSLFFYLFCIFSGLNVRYDLIAD